MFWVLQRIVALKRFFWVPTTYILVEIWGFIFLFFFWGGGGGGGGVRTLNLSPVYGLNVS